MSKRTIDNAFQNERNIINQKLSSDNLNAVDRGLLSHVLNIISHDITISCAYHGSLNGEPKRCLALDYQEIRTLNPCPFYIEKECNYQGNE